MPSTAFVSEEVSKELENESGDDTKVLFPEHHFLSACLSIGLTIQDLKILNYVDVMKIFISLTNKETKQEKKATQRDIDMLLG